VFDSIGWGEIVVLALAALFIFGRPAPGPRQGRRRGLKKVRSAITGVRAQVDESLGDDLAKLRDLDLRQYHPRTFIRNQLLADDEPRRGGVGAHGATTVAAAAARAGPLRPPPFDPDAT
jgi:sec-independent protein translocase protein TatB